MKQDFFKNFVSRLAASVAGGGKGSPAPRKRKDKTPDAGERTPATVEQLESRVVPTFFPAVGSPFVAGDAPGFLAAGPLNQGARPDIIVPNVGDSDISIYQTNSNGSLSSRDDTATEAAGSPIALATGYISGNGTSADGQLDVVVANQATNTLQILLGNGTAALDFGVIGVPFAYLGAGGPAGIAIGNLSGNVAGDDIVVSNFDTGTITVLLNDGLGNFPIGSQTVYNLGQNNPEFIALGNFDNSPDGSLDIAVANMGSDSVTILYNNNNSGTFIGQVTIPVGDQPRGIAAADLDQDNDLDLVVANRLDGNIQVLVNNPVGTFTAGPTFATGTDPFGLAIADFNGDGDPDVVATRANNSGFASVLLGGAGATFGAAASVPTGGTIGTGVVALSLDGDAAPDFVLANETSDSISVLLNSDAVINGTSADDVITVRSDGTNTIVNVNGVDTYSQPTANLTTLTINGLAGNDDVNVDFSGGNPIPAGGITINGGTQTGTPGDRVDLLGGTWTNTTYNYVAGAPGSGSIILDGSTVTYTGLEPITNSGTTVNAIFNLPSGNGDDVVTLEGNGPAGDNISRLRSAAGVPTFEQTDFLSPTATLTINLGNDGETYEGAIATDLSTPTVTINGGALADIVNIRSTNAGTTTTINGGAGNDLINLGNAANLITPIAGPVVANGGANGAEVTVNAQGAAVDANYAITNTTITRSTPTGFGGLTYGGLLPTNNVTLNTGSGANVIDVTSTANVITTVNSGAGTDTINVTGAGLLGTNNFNGQADNDTFNISPSATAGVVVNVDGGNPTDGDPGVPPGDSLNVDLTAVPTPTLTINQAGDGAYTFGGTFQPINFVEIESHDSVSPNLYDLVMNLGAASDVILRQSPTTPANIEILVGGVIVFSGVEADINSFTLNGSAGNDTLSVVETANGLPSFAGTAPTAHGNTTLTQSSAAPSNVSIHFDGNGGVDVGRFTFTTTQNVGYFSDTVGGANSGVVNVAGAFSASFVELAPLQMQGAGGTLTVDASANNLVTTLTITDAPVIAGSPTNNTIITGNAGSLFESVEFGGFDGLLVRSGNGGDTIDLVSLDANASEVAITLDGDNTTNTDAGNDTLRVQSTNANSVVTLLGGAGADNYFVNSVGLITAGITGQVIVQPVADEGTGNDTLTVDDSASATARTIEVTATTIEGATNYAGAGADIVYNEGGLIETINIRSANQADTFNIQSTRSGSTYNVVTDPVAGTGNDTINISSDAPANTGNLDGIDGRINIDTRGGEDTLTVSDLGGPTADTYNLTQVGATTQLSFGDGDATPDIVYNATAGAGQLEHFHLIGSQVDGNVYNINDTTATISNLVEDGAAAAGNSGDSTFNIVPANIEGGSTNTFNGFDGNDTFNLNFGAFANIPANAGTTFVVNGGDPAASYIPNRDIVNFNMSADGTRNVGFNYVDASSGDVNVTGLGLPAGGFVDLNTVELVNYNGSGGNNDNLTVTGTAANDLIAVAPQGANSALVFLGGNPWDGITDPEDFFSARPGVAGGSNGPDLNLNGMFNQTGLTVNGGGGGNDTLYVYGRSELNIEDDQDTTNGNGNVVIPGVGVGNARDEITVTDAFVAIDTTIGAGVTELVRVNINTASFADANPLDNDLVVNTGFEDLNAVPVTGDRDQVLATFSTAGVDMLINGGDPLPANAPVGDVLYVAAPLGQPLNVFSDNSKQPVVSFSAGLGADLTNNVRFSSMERVLARPGNGVVNILGDNNTAGNSQDDYNRIVGRDVDLLGTPFPALFPDQDADGVNEFSLEIGVKSALDAPPAAGDLSSPIFFTGVTRINAVGGSADIAAPVASAAYPFTPEVVTTGVDTLDFKPYADNTPKGWGIETYFTEGDPVADGDLVIFNGVPGVSENISVRPSSSENGQIFSENAATGTPIAVLNYMLNTATIINASSPAGVVGDTDVLTLYGTDGVTSGTSGNDTVVVNYDNDGSAANPFITFADGANPLYSIQTITNFGRVNIDLLAGNDDVTVIDDGGTADGVDFTATALNIVLGDGDDSFSAVGSTSGRSYIINGGAGNDILTGGDGSDTINGGAGNDQIDGGAGDDTIDGGAGDDAIAIDLNGGTDTISGADGIDSLVITGTAGADAFAIAAGTGAIPATHAVVTVGAQVIDTTGVDSVTILGLAGADTFTIGDLSKTGIKRLTVDLGAAGDADQVTVEGTTTADDLSITSAAGDVTIAGLIYDLIVAAATPGAALTVNGNDGDDRIKAAAGVEADIQIILNGGAGNDYLSADATLNGGAGDDTLVGGAGDDTINGNDGDDVIVLSTGNDTIDGGAGFDSIVYEGTGFDDTLGLLQAGNVITVSGLIAGTATITSVDEINVTGLGGDDLINVVATGGYVTTLDGGSGDDEIDATGSTVGLTILGGDGDDTLTGGDGDDDIEGGAGDDQLFGGIGNDTLSGGDGADTLDGGAGDDSLDGGAGSDSFVIDTTTGVDSIDGGAGSDTLTINGTAGADTFNLSTLGTSLAINGAVVGTTDDIEVLNLDGVGGADTYAIGDLTSSSVKVINVSLGAAGAADSVGLQGRATADDIAVTRTGDVISVAGLSYDLAITNASVADTDRLTINGNAGNDTIKAEAGVEGTIGITLNGGSGDDCLSADAILNGGTGDDILIGGAGDDIINGNEGNDTIVLSTGNDIIDGGAGFDSIVYQGTGFADTLGLAQAGNVITVTGLIAGTATITSVDEINVEGLGGDDTITVVATGGYVTTIDGGDGDDDIDATGSTIDLTILGGAGADTITGGSGADDIDGGAGNDTISGGDGDDDIIGGTGNDTIDGDAGADSISGGDGADTLNGGIGDDDIDGGSGNDIIEVDANGEADTIDGGVGADTIQYNGTAGNDTITVAPPAFGATQFGVSGTGARPELESVEQLSISTFAGADSVTFGDMSGTNLQLVSLDLGADADADNVTVNGKGTADNIGVTSPAAGQARVQGLSFDLTVNASTTADRLTVNGNAGDDNLKADAGVENTIGITLNGGTGDDFLSADAILNGGAGNDILEGGAGNDIYNGGDGDDILIISSGNDVLNGDAGFDTIQYKGNGAANILTLGPQAGSVLAVGGFITGSIDIGAAPTVERIEVLGAGGNDTITVGVTSALEVDIDGGAGNDTINASGSTTAVTVHGGDGNDVITGGSGDDDLVGGAGNDTINGGAGADSLDGGAGRDTLNGGTGADLVLGGDDNDSIIIDADGGVDTIDGGSGTDNLVFNGTAGNDAFTLNARVGDPTQFSLALGATSVDPSDVEQVTINALAGNDSLVVGDISTTNLTSVNIDLGAGLGETVEINGRSTGDNISITSPAAGSVTVQGLSYTLGITTVAATDRLTVNGNAGDDTIKANAGVENTVGITLNGNDGDDFLSADAILNGGAGDDTLVGGAGNDVYNGGDGDDILVISAGNDILNGDAGFDTVVYNGSNGADILTLGPQAGSVIPVAGLITGSIDINAAPTVEKILVNGLGGNDTITLGITTALEVLVEAGAGNDIVNATGSTTAVTVHGGDGNDTVTGGSGADTLEGGAGDDALVGGAGVDRLVGGSGQDTLNGGTGADVVLGGEDNDTITIDADGGVDTIDGGTGTDALVFNGTAGADVFTLTPRVGNPTQFTLSLGATSVDPADVEQVQINAQAGADSVTVGDLATTAIIAVGVDLGAGDADTVTINGRNTADNVAISSPVAGTVTAQGLSYTLSLTNSTAADRLTVNGNEGNDTIKANAGVEATIGITLNGGAGDDYLSADAILNGDAGNDTLEGGAGNDQLNGGAGDDLLIVSDGNDTIVGGTGFDTIRYSGDDFANILTLGPQAGSVITVAGVNTGTIDITGAPSVEKIEVIGNGGNDTITVSVTAAVEMLIDAGEGNDVVDASGTVASTILGGDGNDTITGSAFIDYISGGLGNDLLFGGAGDDTIYAGGGNDTLIGGAGVDHEYGEAGNDTFGDTSLNGNGVADDAGADFLFGGDGADTFVWEPGDGSDQVQGGDDQGDVLRFLGSAAANAFLLSASVNNPTHLNVNLGAANVDTSGVEQVVVNALGGDDTVTIGDLTTTEVQGIQIDLGAAGTDGVTVNGRNTPDEIAVSTPAAGTISVEGLSYTLGITSTEVADNLTVNGNNGNDKITGNVGVQTQITAVYNGNDGDDLIIGDGTLNGNDGNDTLIGRDAPDILNGGNGDDFLTGNGGVDAINGGAGFDTVVEARDANFTITNTTLVVGAEGTDTLSSIEAADLTGGIGNNTFDIGAFTGTISITGLEGSDTVDFSAAAQAIVIDLDAAGVTQTINLANQEVTFQDVIENLTATDFNDTINVDIANFDRAIDGGIEDSIPPGDRLNVDMLGSNPTTTKIPNGKLGSFDGTVNGDGYTGTINYVDIETLVIKNGNGGNGGAGGLPKFSSATQYTAGDGPRGLVTADVNGDGNLDMVVANSKSNDISVLLGDAFGAFGPAVTYSAGGKHAKQTTTVAVGDFDGDGDLDIVVTNRKTSNVSVLLNDGTGIFGAATLFSTGAKQTGKFPTSVKLGDMDNDGDLDIVTANSNVRKNGSISVLLNNGAGSFGTANVTKTLGRRPRDLVLIDVNTDGNLDVVATNLFSSNVVLLTGNGAGGLSAPTPISVGVTPNSIISGDFNGDGILDVVTTSLVSPRLSILLGNGTGFQTEKEIKFPATKLDISINTTDIDGDGNLDLLVANRNDNTISYMLGNGNGTFDERVDFKTGATRFREPVAISFGDFNNDGAIDLMVVNAGSDDVSVLLHDPIV